MNQETYNMMEYRTSMQHARHVSDTELSELINIALDTNDREWLRSLSLRQHMKEQDNK